MLQPVPLRGAGGHSRQRAEPFSRLTHCLAHPPPTRPLPFIVPGILLFQTIHPFQLSIIAPSLPAYFPPPPSACSHRQQQPKSLTSTRCTAAFLFWGSPPSALFPFSTFTTAKWMQLNSLDKSQDFTVMITALVLFCVITHILEDFLQQRRNE